MPTESLEHKQDGDNPPTNNSQKRPLDTRPTRDKIAWLVSNHCEADPRQHCQRCQFKGSFSYVKSYYSSIQTIINNRYFMFFLKLIAAPETAHF